MILFLTKTIIDLDYFIVQLTQLERKNDQNLDSSSYIVELFSRMMYFVFQIVINYPTKDLFLIKLHNATSLIENCNIDRCRINETIASLFYVFSLIHCKFHFFQSE